MKIFSSVIFDDSRNFISNDDTDEFLEFWTNDNFDTDINDSTFKKPAFLRQNAHLKHTSFSKCSSPFDISSHNIDMV